MVRNVLIAVLSLGLAASLAACGGGKAQTVQSKPVEAVGMVVQTQAGQPVIVTDNGFAPAEMSVALNTTVVWKNTGVGTHTVSAAGLFDSGNIEPGASWAFTFTKAGNYTYGCSVHPDMKGMVIVK